MFAERKPNQETTIKGRWGKLSAEEARKRRLAIYRAARRGETGAVEVTKA